MGMAWQVLRPSGLREAELAMASAAEVRLSTDDSGGGAWEEQRHGAAIPEWAWSSAVERRGSRLARVGKGKAVTDVLWSSGGSAAACAHGGRPLRVLVLAGAAVKKKKEAWGQSEQRLYIG